MLDTEGSCGAGEVAGAVAHDAVDHDLETEQGNSRDGRDRHEALGSVDSVRKAERSGTD